jgi:hypothetical protein
MKNIKEIEIPQTSIDVIEANFSKFEIELEAVTSEKELVHLLKKTQRLQLIHFYLQLDNLE